MIPATHIHIMYCTTTSKTFLARMQQTRRTAAGGRGRLVLRTGVGRRVIGGVLLCVGVGQVFNEVFVVVVFVVLIVVVVGWVFRRRRAVGVDNLDAVRLPLCGPVQLFRLPDGDAVCFCHAQNDSLLGRGRKQGK